MINNASFSVFFSVKNWVSVKYEIPKTNFYLNFLTDNCNRSGLAFSAACEF